MLSFVPLYSRIYLIGRRKSVTMPLTRSKVKRESSLNGFHAMKQVCTTSVQAESFVPKRRKIEPLLDHDLHAKRERNRVLEGKTQSSKRANEAEASSTILRHEEDSKRKIHARLRVRAEDIPSLDIEDLPHGPPSPQEAHHILQRLREFYRGELSTASHPKTKRRKDLVDSLFATILSQATSNKNSSRAFEALKGEFPKWEDAMNAGAEAIEEQIRCGGLAKAKSKVIHSILRQLYEAHGSCSLEFLWNMSTEKVKHTLCSFNGVGPKTASCVLMFGMQRGEFPVDTHIRRIAARVGWMPPGSSAEKTYAVLNSCLKDEIKYELHVLLIEHGRKTCKAKSPRCDGCPIANVCPSRTVSTSGGTSKPDMRSE
ncbi:HhH-GPD base excision DNA repair protein [Gracilaria domingensis]|nr:HhH-GPD base excision DNA repair protein [Gracilaria domingensis]